MSALTERVERSDGVRAPSNQFDAGRPQDVTPGRADTRLGGYIWSEAWHDSRSIHEKREYPRILSVSTCTTDM